MELVKTKRGMLSMLLAIMLVVTLMPISSGGAAYAEEGVTAEPQTGEVLPQIDEDATASDETTEDEAVVEEDAEATELDSEEATDGDELGEEALATGIEIAPMADISLQVKNLDFNMYREADDVEPARDQGVSPFDNPADYADGFKHFALAYATINFDVDAPAGGFKDGDTITFPVSLANTGGATAPEPFMTKDASNNDVQIGTWRFTAGNSITITLNSAAASFSGLTGCSITTAKSLRTSSPNVTVESILKYQVGNVVHSYKANKEDRGLSASTIAKSVQGETNNSVSWAVTSGRAYTSELTSSGGLSLSNVTSMIVEDEIPASQGATGVAITRFNVRVPFIMSESDPRTASVAGGVVLSHQLNSSYFTEVSQSGTEDYDTFKSRIGTFQYGIYETTSGDFKVVINYGNPQDPAYPLKYSDLWSDFKQALLDADKGLSENEATIIANSLGDNNYIGGNVVEHYAIIKVTYEQAFVDTTKSNTVSAANVVDGAPVVKSSTIDATMKAGSAVSNSIAQSATLAKADGVSGAPMGGVVFTLEKSADGINGWGPSGYGPFTTAADGTVNTGVLAPGFYRFVEFSGHEGYNTAYISNTFEITGGGAGVVVTAINTPKQYKVKYDSDGGTAISDKTVTYWDAGLLPSTAPTKAGTSFSHWEVKTSGSTGTTNGNTVSATDKYQDLADDASTMEITLIAKYNNKSYTVNYDTDGGTPSAIAAKTGVAWGENNLIPATNPTKGALIFAGWVISSGGVNGTAVSAASKYSALATDENTMSITLKATWVLATNYTIRYNANAPAGETATGTMADQAVTAGTVGDTLTNNAFAITGYNFLGWSKSATATTPSYSNLWDIDPDFVPDASGIVNLYAVWSPVGATPNYTVSYSAGLNGIMVPTSASESVAAGANPTASLIPSITPNSGYTFVGWEAREGSIFKGLYSSAQIPAYVVNADVIFTALYAPVSGSLATVIFDYAGGSDGTFGYQVKQDSPSAALTAPTGITKTGYTFDGWNPVVDPTFGAAGTIKVYTAKWKAINYQVTFDKGAHGTMTPDPSSETRTYGQNPSTVPTVAPDAGYSFVGWESSQTGGLYSDTAVLAYVVTDNVLFTAKYVRDAKATVIFDFDGGQNAAGKAYEMIQGYENDPYITPVGDTDFTRAGYTFAGWDNTPSGTFNVAGSITVYVAQWIPNPYNVTFHEGSNGAIAPAGHAEIVNHGDSVVTVPAVTPHTTHEFLGWSMNGGATLYSDADVAAMIITGHTTFTAQYRPLSSTSTPGTSTPGTTTPGGATPIDTGNGQGGTGSVGKGSPKTRDDAASLALGLSMLAIAGIATTGIALRRVRKNER